MNNYNGKTNEEFEKYLVDALETKMHFVHRNDENEFLHPDDAYGEHISASMEKLYAFIKSEIKDSGITDYDEISRLFEEKKNELAIDPKIDDYIERITVDYK